MADLPPQSDSNSDTGTPRWVKVFGVISVIVVLLFVIMLFAGGGRHGPGRHMPRPSATAPAVQQP
jgi:ABC-type transporter Mla subunit MlaD